LNLSERQYVPGSDHISKKGIFFYIRPKTADKRRLNAALIGITALTIYAGVYAVPYDIQVGLIHQTILVHIVWRIGYDRNVPY